MRQLNEAERTEMRTHVLDIVEHGLPPMIPMPVPSFVRQEPWFKESHAEALVRIYALPSYKMNAFNGKLQPALKACLMDEAAGKFDPDTIVIGASSANWAMQMGLLQPIFGYKEFWAVINTKTVPKGKQDHLEASGAKIIPVPDGAIGTEYVYELAQKPHVHLIDQYVHPGSVAGHEWTMNHVVREINRLEQGQDLSFFGAVTGTCSTVRAGKTYLPVAFPKIKIWGVASQSKKEKVPGSRAPEDLDELKSIGGGFDYKTAIDGDLVTSVTKKEVFDLNAEFVQQRFITAGPTGMLLLAGVWHRLRDHWVEHGSFGDLLNNAGMVLGAIFIVDMHLPYLDSDDYRKHFMR